MTATADPRLSIAARAVESDVSVSEARARCDAAGPARGVVVVREGVVAGLLERADLHDGGPGADPDHTPVGSRTAPRPALLWLDPLR